MSAENRDYLELTFKSIQCFAEDGTLDTGELDKLLDIALRDGVVDSNEQRVLKNIISRLTPSELSSGMLTKIEEIKNRHLS